MTQIEVFPTISLRTVVDGKKEQQKGREGVACTTWWWLRSAVAGTSHLTQKRVDLHDLGFGLRYQPALNT